MRECAHVGETEHAGAALDRVRVAEERVDGALLRRTRFEREQEVDHVVETLVRLAHEELEEFRCVVDHRRARSSSAANTRSTSITPINRPSSKAEPLRN